jgi:hypothetical protein
MEHEVPEPMALETEYFERNNGNAVDRVIKSEYF